MTAAPTVDVVVPAGIDDPTRPSGGNVYDRHLCEELTRSGWSVGEHEATATPAGVIAGIPDGRVVLVDGLVAVKHAHDLLGHADRLRIVVLLHMPFGERDAGVQAAESLVLSVASAVVTTSQWSRRWVLEHYALRPERVHVAEPGATPADLAPASDDGGGLLCVAAATADKGHAVLLAALAEVIDLPWRLTCVGSLDRDRELAVRLQRHARELGIADRVTWTGALTGTDLDKAWLEADALLLATRAESWGLVVTEALAHGLPVLATDVGGLPEALGSLEEGSLEDGALPGLLVPADDASALAEAVRRWLSDGDLRHRLREAARARRTTLTGWPVTADRVAQVLAEVAR